MKNWESLFLELEKYAKLEKADEFQCVGYIMEEVGELSRVLSEKHGLKIEKSDVF